MICVPSDAAHIFVRSTGTALCVCHQVYYEPGGLSPVGGQKRLCMYSTFDEAAGAYRPIKTVDIPSEFRFGAAAGSAQFAETDSGDILIPVYTRCNSGSHMISFVIRCGFDGETLRLLAVGGVTERQTGRGLYEPSVCKFGDMYYITLRNDDYGFCAVSRDGIHYTEPQLWKWDNGETVPTYNTQQHWFLCGERLSLVYTRRAGNNDHIFRHRAPLFMARVDTDNMRLIRETEQIVVPQRGARLGNFGIAQADSNCAFITAAEWMQPAGCEKYGSDNSIFVVTVKE